eukprot:CAMPEP_0174727448 /NCGR_PEP_ID=MMETSP1094-20130205/49804_1 /TAXON_ID=156173 /ORGANISM="Chrysochromulina brevifilum, Strain UTEX LB 985" /LENGTH=162 /DNA_ID=CAMNT_0015929191 /DNA_START=94 /DNA_END=579 /DNA_ORIENTATION=-
MASGQSKAKNNVDGKACLVCGAFQCTSWWFCHDNNGNRRWCCAKGGKRADGSAVASAGHTKRCEPLKGGERRRESGTTWTVWLPWGEVTEEVRNGSLMNERAGRTMDAETRDLLTSPASGPSGSGRSAGEKACRSATRKAAPTLPRSNELVVPSPSSQPRSS